jgi:hypothetical protein
MGKRLMGNKRNLINKKGFDTMSIITAKEREYLLSSMEALLEEYDYTYRTSSLEAIIDEWERQKGVLIEAFKKHPNYVEGKFMIAFDADFDRGINKRGSYQFSNWICGYALPEVKDSIPTKVGAFENDKEYVTNGELTNALGPYAKQTDLPTKVGDLTNDQEFTTKTYVDNAIAAIDVTSQLGAYALKTDLTGLASEEWVTEQIAAADITEKRKDYTTHEELQEAIDGVDVSEQL